MMSVKEASKRCHSNLYVKARNTRPKTFVPVLCDTVESLIGPAYASQSMFYFKPPGARGQALHQNNWFLQVSPETCIAAWIAIDDADEKNGSLREVPGTHKESVICHVAAEPSLSFSKDAIPPLPADLIPIKTRLNEGDVFFFHGSLVHGSLPNTTSDRFRRALI